MSVNVYMKIPEFGKPFLIFTTYTHKHTYTSKSF